MIAQAAFVPIPGPARGLDSLHRRLVQGAGGAWTRTISENDSGNECQWQQQQVRALGAQDCCSSVQAFKCQKLERLNGGLVLGGSAANRSNA